MSPAYREYQRHAKRLAVFVENGRGATRIAEAIRDQMEQCWHYLTQAERKQVEAEGQQP